MQTLQDQQIDELRNLIEGIGIAMFNTQDGGRRLHSRPMDTQQLDEDGMFWFLAARSSPLVGEVHAHPAICLTYASAASNTYVVVNGRAQEIHDQAKLSELWSAEHAAFFPGGRHDPDLTLLRVTPEHAEAWTGPSGAVGKLLAFAATALAGEGRTMRGEHEMSF